MTILERWFEEVWNKGNESAIDEMADPNVVGHGLLDADGKEVHNVAGFKVFYKQFRSAFPDIHIEIEETVSEGNKIAARCLVTATHTGQGIGRAPTNKPVRFTGMCIVRIKDGKIAEAWNNFDFLAMQQQLD